MLSLLALFAHVFHYAMFAIFAGNLRNTPQFFKRKYYRFYWQKNRVLKRNAGQDRVLNEPWEWYAKCNTRERNMGRLLFFTFI